LGEVLIKAILTIHKRGVACEEGRKPLFLFLPPPFSREGDKGGGFSNIKGVR